MGELFLVFVCACLKQLYAQRGARSLDPEIESPALPTEPAGSPLGLCFGDTHAHPQRFDFIKILTSKQKADTEDEF